MLRPNGNPNVRDRVVSALMNGTARLCPIVKLELWNVACGDREKKILTELMQNVPELAINDSVWQIAYRIARQARSAGVTVPAVYVLIAACAQSHSVNLETADTDFELLRNLD